MNRIPSWVSSEPPIEDVLDEPIIRLLMRRDNVTPGELRRCILDVRRHLAAPRRPAALPAPPASPERTRAA